MLRKQPDAHMATWGDTVRDGSWRHQRPLHLLLSYRENSEQLAMVFVIMAMAYKQHP
jgi:hypothetical protein